MCREELDFLRQEFYNHVEIEKAQWDRITTGQERNTEAIDRLAESLNQQHESTAEMVQIFKDLKSTAKVGHATVEFLTWVAKFGVVGGAIAAAGHWIVTHWHQ